MRRVVPRQIECSLDVINNGEQRRETFVLYMRQRLSGLGGTGTRSGWQDRGRISGAQSRGAAASRGAGHKADAGRVPLQVGG